MEQGILTGETRQVQQTKNYRIIMRDLYVFGHCAIIWFLLYWFVLNYLDNSHMYKLYSFVITCMTMVTILVIVRDIHFNN